MTVQHMLHLLRIFPAFLSLIVLALLPSRLCGLTVSPGLAMVQNIPLGSEINLGTSGLYICGHNDGDEDQNFSFEPMQPSGVWGRDWEAGYEAFPDLSWCHMVESVLTCKPKEIAKGELVLNIPDKPENWNRKWVLCVLVKKQTSVKAIIGAGFAISVRIMIETRNKDKQEGADGIGAGPLAFVPGTITLKDCKPGEKYDFDVDLRNNSGVRLTCQTERLNQIYSKEHKYKRYTTTGFEALLADSWTKVADETFSLETDKTLSFKMSGSIPENVDRSKQYEELVFVRGTGPVSGDDGTEGLAAMTFIRVRYLIANDESKESNQEPKQAPEPAPSK